LREIVNIVAYFLGVVLLGALIAPPLYWAGQAAAQGGLLSPLAGVEFQKFFNRAMLIAAVALLWPTIRVLRIWGWKELGLQRDARAWQHAIAGASIAVICVATMAVVYVAFDVYRWKERLPWERMPQLLLSAVVVAFLEEALFRGAIFGLFRRTLRPFVALFLVSLVFAAVHFLKPDESIRITEVGWLSGFALLPHVFHQFSEPMTLLAQFTTIFVLGWVLGYATLRTRSLWMAIGLHAGVVFVKMTFSKFTKRQHEFLPWIGSELQIGLVPVAVLALCGLCVWFWLAYVDVDAPNGSIDR
jgi:membrane protease YdiL (CAAX protease family)